MQLHGVLRLFRVEVLRVAVSVGDLAKIGVLWVEACYFTLKKAVGGEVHRHLRSHGEREHLRRVPVVIYGVLVTLGRTNMYVFMYVCVYVYV